MENSWNFIIWFLWEPCMHTWNDCRTRVYVVRTVSSLAMLELELAELDDDDWYTELLPLLSDSSMAKVPAEYLQQHRYLLHHLLQQHRYLHHHLLAHTNTWIAFATDIPQNNIGTYSTTYWHAHRHVDSIRYRYTSEQTCRRTDQHLGQKEDKSHRYDQQCEKNEVVWEWHSNRLIDDRWTSCVTTWRPCDKKRPAKQWRDELNKYWSDTIWQTTTQDRLTWRGHAQWWWNDTYDNSTFVPTPTMIIQPVESDVSEILFTHICNKM